MQDIGTPANLDGVNHLANLNYAACVRMESGYCGIRWAQYPSDAVSFTISGRDVKGFIRVKLFLRESLDYSIFQLGVKLVIRTNKLLLSHLNLPELYIDRPPL